MRNSRAASADGGFTLIETIVVLVVLALMASLLVSRGPTRSATLDLTAASRSLADALRAARGHAITTDQPVRIGLDTLRGVIARHASRSPAGPISVALHSPADDPHENGTLRFDPDGGANGARLVLAEGHERLSIDVDWLTGRITQGPVRRDDDS